MRPTKTCRVSFEELLDLHESRADADSHQRLYTHLAEGCSTCEAQLAEIGRLHSVMRQGELASAPDHVLSRAKDLFRERFVKPARRSLLAQLVFDSRTRLALSGARGAESGQLQSLYSTDEHDVDLWQERAANGLWYVIGQVMPHDGGASITPVDAELRSGTGTPFVATREGAEFHLSAVAAGTYTLRITLPDVEITADGVRIGA